MKQQFPNTKTFLNVLFCSILLCLTSCSEDETPAVSFALEEAEIYFNADGGNASFKLTSGSKWTVTCDREWCLVSPTNGDGSTVCEVRVDSSYLYTAREAHLNFHCGTQTRQLTVSQLGYEKVIKVEKAEIEVPDFSEDAQYTDVRVQANVDYAIEVEYTDPARTGWVEIRKVEQGQIQSIPRSGKVRILYQMYLQSDKDREATLVFRQTDAKEGETPVETRVKLRQTKAQEIIPSREGDSLALLTLSRIMHLSTSWDVSQPMIYWNNIKMEDVKYFNTKLGREVVEPRVVAAAFTMFETDGGIPYHVRYLDQMRDLSFIANGNAHLKQIDLGEHVTYLENLKYLTLMGYGISRLPERMKEMKNLEELELSGNNFTTIPMDIIEALDKHSLRYINLANNRVRDVFGNLFANRDSRQTLGLHGALPKALFELKNIRYIGLSYNYLEGSIPDMDYDASQYATLEEKVKNNPIMPQLEQLSINLNFLTGELPDWILYHPNLRCWDPYTLVFNQYERARDSSGRNVGFTNEPSSVQQACTLWSADDNNAYDGELGDGGQSTYNRQNTFNPSVKYETRLGTEYR